MGTSRHGVELAYALLTVTVFQHNEAISAKRGGHHPLPIAAYSSSVGDHMEECFGLSGNRPPRGEGGIEEDMPVERNITMANLTHKQVQDAVVKCG